MSSSILQVRKLRLGVGQWQVGSSRFRLQITDYPNLGPLAVMSVRCPEGVMKGSDLSQH